MGGCGSEEPGSGGADESTGRPAEIVVALGIRVGGVHVLEIDAATGEAERTLFEVAERPAFRSLVADPTGRHLLFTTVAGAAGDDKVSRWSDGEEPVVLLETSSGETAEDAVWVPIVSGG